MPGARLSPRMSVSFFAQFDAGAAEHPARLARCEMPPARLFMSRELARPERDMRRESASSDVPVDAGSSANLRRSGAASWRPLPMSPRSDASVLTNVSTLEMTHPRNALACEPPSETRRISLRGGRRPPLSCDCRPFEATTSSRSASSRGASDAAVFSASKKTAAGAFAAHSLDVFVVGWHVAPAAYSWLCELRATPAAVNLSCAVSIAVAPGLKLARPRGSQSGAEDDEGRDGDPGEWCHQAAPSRPLLRWRQPTLARQAQQAPPPRAGGPARPGAAVPAWARFPGEHGGTRFGGDGGPGDGSDPWAPLPGASFESVHIEFKDAGGGPAEEEASTCSGEEAEDESLLVELDAELDAMSTEVVTGYRADVGAGCGLPEDDGLESEDEATKPGRDHDALEAVDGGGRGQERRLLLRAGLLQKWAAPHTPPVTHIIFVVHGMGATEEGLRKNVRDLSAGLSAMQKYWFWHTNINTHVEMIDWKSTVKATQNSIFERITPGDARSTRMTLNATLSDVIFYKTPHHRSKIHDTVAQKMNTRIRMLRSETSGRFAESRVSIVGHSLGSVIAHDVLTRAGGDEASALEFEVDSFFLWGSPLAAFVSISDAETTAGQGKFTLPNTLGVYNVFHPHDPVAFRLEPLFYHDEEQMPPEVIPYWANNGVRPSKQWARSYEYAKGLARQKWTSMKSQVWDALGSSSAEFARIEWDNYLNAEQDSLDCPTGTQEREGREDHNEEKVEDKVVKPKMRVDYVLQEHAVESYVETYGLLHSHFCYWTSEDVALLMLKMMSRQETAELNAAEKEQQEASAERAAAKAAGAARPSGAGAAAASAGGASEEPDVAALAPPHPEPSAPAKPAMAALGPASAAALAMLPALPDRIDFIRRFEHIPCVGYKEARGVPSLLAGRCVAAARARRA
ncbi:unnamed protein product [Prorocentrum cordatum]|uniref:DDHD domain-containing protein n=1 Tax=Prorocentrum cordatum TaxID=2364126 RepID=A0ABN9PU65_9DINO|nr:unnamed protein product [Polarella glacialis]